MAQAHSTKVRDAIVAANKGFMKTVESGDAAGMPAHYTVDCQVLPPNGDFVIGEQAVESLFQSLMDMGIKKIKLETLEVEGHDDTAYEIGKFILQGEGGQALDKGKYIVIWKQEDGQWKLHRDIFNSSMPPPEA
jgi:uncharacterized protein (TIGR02246 family)